MDLLDEYHEHIMDDFIEKSDDKGHMVIYSPHRDGYTNAEQI